MARRPPIPARADDVDLEWLRWALSYSAPFEPSQLQAIHFEPVGSGRGLLSTVIRCRLSWSPEASQQPSSVIIKLRSSDRKTARLARLAKLYRSEYLFYRRIRLLAGLRSPDLLYGDFAARSHRFVLVLEDLSGLESVPQAARGQRISSAVGCPRGCPDARPPLEPP